MKKTVIRLLSVILSIIIVSGVMPVSVFAQPESNVAEVWVNGEMKKASSDSFEEIWKEAVSLASRQMILLLITKTANMYSPAKR